MSQEFLIECDHCDYAIPNKSKNPNESIEEYVNKPCPVCGHNLLTEEDYKLSEKYMSVLNWINKYFSWLTFFSRGKKEKPSTFVKIYDSQI